MEDKNIRTSLVSRLPKYGSKPVGNILQTVPNGTALNLSGSSQSNDKNFSKHNGTTRMSSFSFNWRKSNKYQLGDQISSESSSSHNSNERLTDSDKGPQTQGAVGKEVLRVTSNGTSSKIAKQNNIFASSTEELNKKSLPGLTGSAKFTKSSLLSRSSYSGLNAPKPHLNGFCGNRSTIGLQRNRGNSAATRSSSGESLAKSTDNVNSCEKMVRSQSFSHSIQSTLLSPTSLTRSHSFNRAVDLARPYQNQHLAIKASQRSNLLSRSARQLDMPNSNETLRYGFARSYAALAPSGLKKQPVSNGAGDAPSLRFRTGRPSLLKLSSQQLGRKIPVDGIPRKDIENCQVDGSIISTNISGDIDAKSIQNNDIERTEVQLVSNNLIERGCKVICTGGDVDEISISSLSSSEKNDLSEDFSDDFIDLEDPNRTITIKEEEVSVHELEHGNGIPPEQILSLKESERSSCNSDEWLDIHVSEVEKSESAKPSSGNNVISSDMDYRASSSFELSPSDSSDGTYMWDEEGLEPIGSVHPCGSYDSSEMNSIDILNNLDSCDLEDDDLMLDVELPEDTPCDNVDCENMNRYDRSDRNIRTPKEVLWKRVSQRWNTQDHYHLGHADHYPHKRSDLNRGSNYLDVPPFGHLEGYGAPSVYPSLVGLPANTVMLDEMTLRHMVQDCTAVKTQLLKMKRILHQNDESVPLHNSLPLLPSSPEPQEPEPYKTKELLSEIMQLKEDLKKKDETIKRLENRLSCRCNCNGDSKKPEEAGCTYADKFTQTSWRRSVPQVLHPSSLLPSFTNLAQGKLIKMSHIAAHSEQPDPNQQKNGDNEYQNAASGSFTDSQNELSTLNKQLNVKKAEEKKHSIRIIKVKESSKELKELTSKKINVLQSLSLSSRLSSQANTHEVQTKLVQKNHCSWTNQAPSPKTSRVSKLPNQKIPAPPQLTVGSASQTNCSTSRVLDLQSSNSALQAAGSPSDPNRSRRISKLRPPTFSFRPHQMTNPKLVIPPEPQITCSKTSRPRQQAKENMQNQGSNVHSSESVTLNQHSRLPKPKTY